MKQAEFESLIADETKRIDGDIVWKDDEDHSPSVEFRVEVENAPGYPLFLVGSFNEAIGAITFAVIHKKFGRIYALDLGKDHQNPDGNLVGEKHKHRWTEKHKDKEAYVPDDITATVADPVAVWVEFCTEAKISHTGKMQDPRPNRQQKELF